MVFSFYRGEPDPSLNRDSDYYYYHKNNQKSLIINIRL